jgi:hypothetical protein
VAGFFIFIGAIACLIGVICICVGMDSFNDVLTGFGVFLCFTGALTFFISIVASNTPDPKKEAGPIVQTCTDNGKGVYDQCRDSNGCTPVQTNDPNAQDINNDGKKVVCKEDGQVNEQVKQSDPPQPQPEPKQEEKKDFDWQKWADDSINHALISCNPDGEQVYVYGSQDIDKLEAGPDAIAMYVRVHKDGKPFTCSDPKEPAKEESL